MSKSFLKFDEIPVFSKWKPCDGSNLKVTVVGKDNGWIYYTHSSDTKFFVYDKDTFGFQTRYEPISD
jgi:hypothetical protein